MSLSELKKEVVKDSKERIIGKADLEILIAISALKEFKKWDSCIQLLREHRIPLTHVNLRHYFFSQQIIEALQIHKKPNLRVLEIGGGGGNLKTILKIQLNNLIQNYFIIDLPEMLDISAYSTSRFFKFEKIEFLDTYNKTDLSPGSSYLSAGDLDFFDNINTRKFDLILNTHSFQEMDNSVVRSYFELIYQQANKNCLFFQSNWYQSKMSQLDGSFMDNNPEDYPYRGSDEIIFEGEDPFTHYLSSKLSYKPTRRSFTSIRYINLNTVA
jgi:hypothetical protein